MAALALGAAGAGIGSMFGFASIGWSIGSAIGNYLFAPDQPDIQGPRLTDRSVTGSAYGTMRPLLFGTYRMSGEIIWADELTEHADKEETGGKGGGGGSYTTYTYTASFAVALCEGEITAVRKIWMDSKLVYTADGDSSISELIVSNKLAKKIKVYVGSETQVADATIEAVEGSGNVPGYRGTAYVVFEDLEVTQFGNRIPQLSFEVVKDGSYAVIDDFPADVATSFAESVGIANGIVSYFHGSTYSSSVISITQTIYSPDDLTVPLGVETNTTYHVSGLRRVISVSPSYKFALALDSSGGTSQLLYLLAYVEDTWLDVGPLRDIPEDLDNLLNLIEDCGHLCKWWGDYNFCFYKSNSGDLYTYEIEQSITASGAEIRAHLLWSEKVASDKTDAVLGAPYSIAIDQLGGDIYVGLEELATEKIKRYSASGDLLDTKLTGAVYITNPNGAMAYSDGKLWQVYPGATLRIIEWDTDTIIHDGNLSSTSSGWVNHPPTIVVAGNVGFMSFDNQLYSAQLILSSSSVSLATVVEEICNKVGIDDADLDVTDLTSDNVRGYLISQQTPARGALEQLSAAYFFDARESDGVLEFIKRGDTPIVTLDDDDLGCYEGDDVQELADAVRTQEEELPKALTINYANVGNDYQVGAQHSIRQSVLNGTEATIQLPIAFTDDEAKSIVDKMMFSAWENRHKLTLKTWQGFCKVEPADVITARDMTLRVISRNEGVNGLIELEAVRELPQIYTGQIGAGSSGATTGQSVVVGGPTKFYLLDVPPLRDADYDSYGFYAAANGLLSGWSGYVLVRSNDLGISYQPVINNDVGAAIGQATTVLGDFDGGNIFDETNVVRVQVTGTLETKTRTQVLDGGNVAIIGDEIIQFRTATLVSTGVYDLSGLLRGRIGTEWAMGSHVVNERFCLVTSASTRFVDVPYTDLNSLKRWGAITFGDTIEDIVTKDITYAGNNFKPLTPVHIGGGTTGTNTDWTIKWKKRSRYQWQWRDYFDVSDDESSDDFEVRIYDDATVKRTITVTNAETTTYTYAQQVTDFSGYQNTIDVSVRQVGSTRNSEWSDIFTLDSGISVILSTSLLHLNGADASTTITDVYSPTWTAFGNAKLSTTSSKFGSACLLLDGTGDYIKSTSITSLGSLPWCIEGWFRWETLPGVGAYSMILTVVNATGYGVSLYLVNTGGTRKLKIYMSSNGTSFNITSGTDGAKTSWSAATYYHVALVFTGSAYKIYVEGVQDYSLTSSSTICPITQFYYGSSNGGGEYFNGRMDELRVTLGDPRYTGAFTPSSSEFTE